MKIDLFTVFSTFDINNLGKIVLHHWKGKTALMLVKLPNLTVIRLNRAHIQLHKVAKFYRRLYGGRQVCAPPPPPLPTHPYKRLQNFATSSLVFNKSLSNLAILLILRRSFQWCRRISPSLSMSKVEKTVKRSICTELICFLPHLGSCP